MSEALHVKHRPDIFEDVIGQDAQVISLRGIIKRGTSQSFLFAGPSGTGKTTLARIAAHETGCIDQNIMEIDAATHTGVDSARSIQEAIRYKPFGKSEMRACIIDEAHGLSRQSWDSLLKVIEEPPKHMLWFLCTTNLGKIPVTIKTRCATFHLKLLGESDIREVVRFVTKAEKIVLDASVEDLVVKEALGSPRQALVNLEMCRDVKDRKTAALILHSAAASDATLELCRYLMKPGSWAKASAILAKLVDESPESVRIIVANYMAACVRNSKSEREVCYLLSVLEEFAQSYSQSDGMAPLYLSVGHVLFRSQ